MAMASLLGCGGGGSVAPQEVQDPPYEAIFPASSITLSPGDAGDKPKIQRTGDGTLIVVYGDAPDSTRLVYDVQAAHERPARDIFVTRCTPDATRTCDLASDWSAPLNLSGSSAQSSIDVAWRGLLEPGLKAYPGDVDKANVKTSGSVLVVTWVSKYCPDGDPFSAGQQPGVQRAIRYLERDSRVIPFACTWMARSLDNGTTWSAAVQLSNGERDAIQDSSWGNYSAGTRKGQVIITWQEDPQGLQLGEADGPGDGAAGANVTGGTDIWYTFATIDRSVANTPSDDFVLTPPVRLTDNWQGLYGVSGAQNPIFGGSGANVDPDTVERGQAGASRANVSMVGTTALVIYEETKASEGLAEGKFVRYHAFAFDAPPSTPEAKAGCILSDPLKNARRPRMLTQGPSDAGPGGIQLAVFWREGIYDRGGSADIALRRGIGGVQPQHMVPAVDARCAALTYADALALTSARGENISSRSATVTDADDGLADDTEANYTENALAHRGVLRGADLWIGYSYTGDLVRLWAQLDNYNFWLRKYTYDAVAGQGRWDLPRNLTRITDTRINVREPRLFGTPKSSTSTCPSGNPADPTTTDPAQCQNSDVIYLAWGTQENVSPLVIGGGADLGVFITVSLDAAQTFIEPVRLSAAMGGLFQDDEAAFESQLVAQPDGRRFFGVWNQRLEATGQTWAQYAHGDITLVTPPKRWVPL